MSEEFEGLGLVDLLDLLEPVPEPPPISLMPQTMGWVWLGLGLLALATLALRRWQAHRQAQAYRKAGLQALAAAGDNPAEIAVILRRTALGGFPRTAVASLHGPAWLAFLDRTCPDAGFQTGPGATLARAPYTDVPADPALAALARHWITHHRQDTA